MLNSTKVSENINKVDEESLQLMDSMIKTYSIEDCIVMYYTALNALSIIENDTCINLHNQLIDIRNSERQTEKGH
jgi:hypothetical protein